ncbi:MAG: S1C family serine protease [Planctomycetota bacterium]|jgi:S1-C subfamily serine protease
MRKILVLLPLLFVFSGCTRVDITSEPPGADIYSGQYPRYLTRRGKTPYKHMVAGLYYVSDVYYQLKKDGYQDTGIVHFPPGKHIHAIRATLQPVVQIIRQRLSATGFAISEDGLIVTAYHVIKDAKVIKVYLSKGTYTSATILHSDPMNDLAVLKIETPTPDFLQIAPMRTVMMGDKVFTIGFPMSSVLGQKAKYSDGVVSALSGLKDASSFLQITVPILPGNSGGPLINEKGQVVGIITSTATILPFIEQGSTMPQNVNWAVKAGYLKPLIELPLIDEKPLNKDRLIHHVKKSIFFIETE